MWEVLVGNIGIVFTSEREDAARWQFTYYLRQSRSGTGRAAREPVTLLLDGDIVAEYEPTNRTAYEGEFRGDFKMPS